MKYNALIGLLLPAILLSSCDKVKMTSVWDDPNFFRVTAVPETAEGQEASEWAVDDVMKIFDADGNAFDVKHNPYEHNIFFTEHWTGGEPGYAVYPSSENLSLSGEKIKGIDVDGFSPVLVGNVAGHRTDYRIDPMKGVLAKFTVSLGRETTKSITIIAPGGEKLVGCVDVDCAALNGGNVSFWSLSAGSEGEVSLTITPEGDAATEEGTFKPATFTFYLLPQRYKNGLRLLAKQGNDKDIIQNFHEDGITLGRNTAYTFDGDLDDTMPSEIILSIDFYNTGLNWPFLSPVKPTSEQSPEGDEYIYRYTYDLAGVEQSMEFPFVIGKSPAEGSSYSWQHYSQLAEGYNVLCFSDHDNPWIKLPAIPGRYLQTVSMSHGNSGLQKRFRIQEDPSPTSAMYYNSPVVKAQSFVSPGKSELTFPQTDTAKGKLLETEAGKSYYILFSTAANGTDWTGRNIRVFNVTARYTKSL